MKTVKLKKDGTPSKQGEGAFHYAKFDKESELQRVIGVYLDTCRVDKIVPNKSGLCAAIGVSRTTYNEYKKKWPNTIKRVEDLIESIWVQRLNGVSTIGAIFYLKNAFKEDYRDRYDNDITSGGKPLGKPILDAISSNNSPKKNPAAN